MNTSYARPFWDNVDDSAGPAECWPWQRGTTSKGYGQTSFWDPVTGRWLTARTHRVAFFVANGYWPDHCRHDCDNPVCCNPLHLSDGTNADNTADKMARGRHYNQRKTHCKRGHPLSGNNLLVHPQYGYRSCRNCKTQSDATSRARRKGRKS